CFQAEDGIRDFHVTGVQTCALPISTANALLTARVFGLVAGFAQLEDAGGEQRVRGGAEEFGAEMGVPAQEQFAPAQPGRAEAERSEERRVGKEGRWREAPPGGTSSV